MREIIFDTETTGLDNRQDRIIEIGGIELDNHFPTGRTFHVFINPGDRKVHPDALAIHGISDDFLKDKPPFAGIVEELLAFFDGARWVAHNATFDMGFINAEFARLGLSPVSNDLVTDTLVHGPPQTSDGTELARCPLPSLRYRQFASNEARRAARLRTLG